MSPFLWVALGSALGGVCRYTLGRFTGPWNLLLPWTTILINIFGSFLIAFFGTLTLAGSRYAASENVRLFVMVGVCGGFTTFSSFSLQTFDLARGGAFGRALWNIGISVILCLGAVALGHYLAQRATAGPSLPQNAIFQTADEELS